MDILDSKQTLERMLEESPMTAEARNIHLRHVMYGTMTMLGAGALTPIAHLGGHPLGWVLSIATGIATTAAGLYAAAELVEAKYHHDELQQQPVGDRVYYNHRSFTNSKPRKNQNLWTGIMAVRPIDTVGAFKKAYEDLEGSYSRTILINGLHVENTDKAASSRYAKNHSDQSIIEGTLAGEEIFMEVNHKSFADKLLRRKSAFEKYFTSISSPLYVLGHLENKGDRGKLSLQLFGPAYTTQNLAETPATDAIAMPPASS